MCDEQLLLEQTGIKDHYIPATCLHANDASFSKKGPAQSSSISFIYNSQVNIYFNCLGQGILTRNSKTQGTRFKEFNFRGSLRINNNIVASQDLLVSS